MASDCIKCKQKCQKSEKTQKMGICLEGTQGAMIVAHFLKQILKICSFDRTLL